MVMANIIVTPEKRRAMKRRAKTVKTITLRQNLGHLDRSCIGWKILPCLEKCFQLRIPSAGQFLKGVLFMIILSTVVKHTLKCLLLILQLPINGLSEVMGMIAETVFKNIVKERRMVTPGREIGKGNILCSELCSPSLIQKCFTRNTLVFSFSSLVF